MRGFPTWWALIGFTLGRMLFHILGTITSRRAKRLETSSEKPLLKTALFSASWWVIA